MRRKNEPPKPKGLQMFLDAAALAAGVLTFADLLAAPRTRTFVMWRQAIMLVLRDKRCMSFPEIAWVFGYDHSTCVHGVTQARRRWAQNVGLWRQAVAQLESLIVMDQLCTTDSALCQGTIENV